ITSVDPLSGAPGQQVAIHGLHFRTSDAIMFGSAAATSVSSAPDAHVAFVPSLPPGTVSVNVTDILGRLSTTGPIFTVLDNTPQVTHISPTSLPAGAELTIDGSGFRATYTFTIGGQTARIVTMSFNRAIVRVPALAPGSYELRVVNATGQVVANGGSLTVTQSGLVISSAEPSCARADGGSVLHILGGGFASGATLTIGDVFATNVAVSDASHIIATLPPLPPGRATVVVRNPNGESATATNAVAVYSPFDPDGCPASYKMRAVRH
ncbi:MAG: large repetitive protein, partial [Thermoanaerobaculia bacterium]|nr:large repetitive protein [Thermoanaerobaculia bacterium]